MKRPKRKPIPAAIKTQVVTLQKGCCAACRKPLDDTVEFDHRPALVLRRVNEEGTDYVPPQLAVAYLEALHARCHLERTVGRKPDADKTVTTKGSDAWLAAKFRRLENPRKKRRSIPSRPFTKKGKKHVKA